MYLYTLKIKNFRCFEDSQEIEFNKGLNVLVGENDSGKSAIIDAIRIVMGTTDQGWYRIEPTDFYGEHKDREISITLKFSELSKSEQASFLECLSCEEVNGEQSPCLYVNWKCKYLSNFHPPRLSVNVTTGINGDGPPLPAEARELLRVTYLRPLRDSYSNMQSGRNSRLSQIIQGMPDIDNGITTYTDDVELGELSISGIASLSNHLLANHPKLKSTNEEIDSIMSDKMLLKSDKVSTAFEVAGNDASDNKRLVAMLEKLDLTAHDHGMPGKIGLGTSNILSMACELLLNRNSGSSFLLIEEPEAHVHAQRQLRLIQSLQEEASSENANHQIIVTTHSPLMASVVKLENISIVKSKMVYSLSRDKTKLEADDYKYLERYLDATKANLFFAKAVMAVEGPSEELLIPTIARLLGKDFTEYGVSIVNTRGTGHKRFARIFQRKDENEDLGIKVACVADCDVMPDCAPAICIDGKYLNSELPEKTKRKWMVESDFSSQEEKEKYLKRIRNRADGKNVETFISDHWTFEYDLAYAGLHEEMIDAIAQVHCGDDNKQAKVKEKIQNKYQELADEERKASFLYSFFTKGNISKPAVAQQLSFILEERYKDNCDELRNRLPQYIKEAINYLVEE